METIDAESPRQKPIELSDVVLPSVHTSVNLAGPPVPPKHRVYFYSSDEWEEFLREWVTTLEPKYVQVKRLGGPGDLGVDSAGFRTEAGFEGAWDCFQGKHYSNALRLGDAPPEILKVFVHAARGQYTLPAAYVFLAPRGCGTTLDRLLSRPVELRSKFVSVLDDGGALTDGLSDADLEQIKALASETDFAMFRSAQLDDVLAGHRKTPYHAGRFGTSLAPRPPS